MGEYIYIPYITSYYMEIMYKTGDLAFEDENSDLVFSGRKGF